MNNEWFMSGVSIEGVMIAARPTLKRLIKQRVRILFSWFKTELLRPHIRPTSTFSWYQPA
jgi:hypothetical protein